MRLKVLLFLLIFLLQGCAPSSRSIQIAIEKTQTALPSKTPTLTYTLEPTKTSTPETTDTPASTNTPESTNTPKPTRTPHPSHTPRPTYTPDTRTDFEKCEQYGIGVRYVIKGSGVDGVSITEQNDSNGINQGDFGLPYCNIFMNFNHDDFVYISAQIIYPIYGAGSITCIIYDGDSIIAAGSASGFPNIATCSGTTK